MVDAETTCTEHWQDELDTDPDCWPKYGIPDLLSQVETAREEKKWLFIWDKTDNIDTFFKYKGFLVDFFFTHRKVEHGRITADDAVEEMRDAFIKAGRQGYHMLINLNDSCPDFKTVYSNPNVLAIDIAFDHDEWVKEEVHMAVLKDGENYSANAQNSGLYYLQPDFTM